MVLLVQLERTNTERIRVVGDPWAARHRPTAGDSAWFRAGPSSCGGLLVEAPLDERFVGALLRRRYIEVWTALEPFVSKELSAAVTLLLPELAQMDPP
ncbi:hypothetical protein [Streptomyces sp. NPDC051214]|uniref:hypothetical protein n=1 Tax=Streptomyces sp. NPDC051214 TaxID=3155282 RepID=UPI003428BF90